MELTKSFFEAMKILKKTHSLSLRDISLTHSQIFTLKAIDRLTKLHETSPKPSELSDLLEVAPATITPVLNRLESEGLICREYSKQDRRQVFLVLTEQGKQQVAEIHGKMNHYYSRLIEDIGIESVMQFLEFTKRIESFNQKEIT